MDERLSESPPEIRDDIFITSQFGSIDGYVEQGPDGTQVAVLDYIEVAEEARGRGVGSGLVREFARRSILEGASRLEALAIEPRLFSVVGSVFGRDNLALLSGGDERLPLDVTYDEALARLSDMAEIAEQYEALGEDVPDEHRTAIRVLVDLTAQDVADHLEGPPV